MKNIDEYNNDFLGYNGYINRKNYAINLLILFALYFATTLVDFNALTQYTNISFIKTVLIFIVDLFKFVLVIAALSVVYRRIMDISKNRSSIYASNMKKLYAIIFVFPIFYLFCFRYFLDIIPFLMNLLNIFSIVVLLPIAAVFTIVLSFVKGQ